ERADQPRHWMRVYVHSRVLVRFLRMFFDGRTESHEKQVPQWFLRMPQSIQKAFVGAVFAGDGVISEKSVGLFLANPGLIRQIYTILFRLNVVASVRWEGMLRYTKHRGMWINVGTQPYADAIKAWIRGDFAVESTLVEVDKNYFYKVLDGDLFIKVKQVTYAAAEIQTVYDLAVEDDHSFTVCWLGAHNCYVIPVRDDSIESIFDWMREAARTYSLGGGVGTDLSVLRPRGAPVNNAARSSTGSVSFMELFSLTTGTIGQSGRRGALMITIADSHPDVLDFVKVKRNLTKVRYANISVRVSDAFMRAVESDREFPLGFANEHAEVSRMIRARDLWSELIKGARDYAEPGLIFWDQIKYWSTSEYNGMGDMLIKLGLKYDTDEAVGFVDQLFERIKNVVYDESVNLACEKGVFPAYDADKHLAGRFVATLQPPVLERIRRHGLRNVALLTVPPVGSGAALAGVTSGIEPIFDRAYVRRSESLSQETFKVYHPLVREYMARFEVEREEDLPLFFVTAHQIKPEMRVKMQAAIQKHIDHSISSTVNLPRDATLEDVKRVYLLAWKLGAKGITVYREPSREGILITEEQAAAQSAVTAPIMEERRAATPRPRPKVTVGRTERVETPRGRIYVVVNEDEWGVCEVFVHSLDVEAEGVGRLASLALRGGIDPRGVSAPPWPVPRQEGAFDRSSSGTVVRVTTIAQA